MVFSTHSDTYIHTHTQAHISDMKIYSNADRYDTLESLNDD